MSLFLFEYDYLIMFQSAILYHKTTFHSDFLDEDIYNLLDRTYALPKDFNFKIFKVDQEKYIARPDLVSYEAYGDFMFADIICKLNGISNPFELNKDMILIIPSQDCVQNFIQAAPIREMESSNTEEVPKPKQKTSKRASNDAVLGDKRFKIDSNKRIVIY